MQIYVLLLIMVLLGVGPMAAPPPASMPTWQVVALAVGPYLLPMALAWGGCVWAVGVMRHRSHRARRAVERLHMGLTGLRWLSLGWYIYTLAGLGWLAWLQANLGDLVLVHELIVLIPPLLVPVVMWWAYYPVERRMREQMLLRQLDRGEPVYAFYRRGPYVLEQVRHQLLLILVPMVLVLLWIDLSERYLLRWLAVEAYAGAVILAGGLAIFAVAPLIIRRVWNTIVMPAGELRERLVGLCRLNGVKVRELLLWRTHTGLVNGAVLGLAPPLRYILLTDGLVEQLSNDQIEAVMAHELGHVRRRHMFWLAVCAFGTLVALFTLADLLLVGLAKRGWIDAEAMSLATWQSPHGDVVSLIISGGAVAAAMLGWIALFGYISRRFERQADTFAAQHFAIAQAQGDAHPHQGDADDADDADAAPPNDQPQPAAPPTITPHAAEVMAGALLSVASLNAINPARKSWRHGSIDWRAEYLRNLVGTRVDRCQIDRDVRAISYTCGLLLIAALAVQRFVVVPLA